MTDQNGQNTSSDLASGEAGADQEAWEGADNDTSKLVSSDQTSSGTQSQTVDGSGTEDADDDEVEATEEAVEEPAPSTELDEPLTGDASEGDASAASGDDADGSADHQPESGPASEATDDARTIYDTAPD
ncbi:MAG TPA: hypothetical protein VNJ54_08210 [Plantibacter sp.]|uniref:hypothetical protein n=1 Tax=Plantibacter sp. TaxID=1871045 RepID=UPI002B8CF169|nr:hypothetical protein [Plantibacter sp.]